jgi:hypothetical protein
MKTKRTFTPVILVHVLMLAWLPTASFGQAGVHDPTRILEFTGNECAGAAPGQCAAAEPRRYFIPRRRVKTIELACPQSRPHVVGWDTRHQEHISIDLVPAAATAASDDTQGPGGFTLLLTNHADAPGFASVVLGCAAQPTGRAVIVQHKSAVPTGRLQRGEARP